MSSLQLARQFAAPGAGGHRPAEAAVVLVDDMVGGLHQLAPGCSRHRSAAGGSGRRRAGRRSPARCAFPTAAGSRSAGKSIRAADVRYDAGRNATGDDEHLRRIGNDFLLRIGLQAISHLRFERGLVDSLDRQQRIDEYPVTARGVGMRPAEVCGLATKPISSRSAMMLRMVAGDSSSPWRSWTGHRRADRAGRRQYTVRPGALSRV